MRYVIEEASPRHWIWRLMWADRHVADAPVTYGSEAEACRAAERFSRAVEVAGERVRRG